MLISLHLQPGKQDVDALRSTHCNTLLSDKTEHFTALSIYALSSKDLNMGHVDICTNCSRASADYARAFACTASPGPKPYFGHLSFGSRTATVLNLLLQWQHCHQRLVAVTSCTSCPWHSSRLRSVVLLHVLHWKAVTFSLQGDTVCAYTSSSFQGQCEAVVCFMMAML